MAERVGEIEVYARLDDDDLQRGLRNIDDTFDRTKRKLEREQIVLDIKVEEKQAKKDLEELVKTQQRAQGKLNRARSDESKKYWTEELKQAKKAATEQRKLIKGFRDQVKERREENRQLALTDRLTAAVITRENQRQRALAQAERRREAAAKRAERDMLRANTQRERAAQKAQIAYEREMRAIPKMQRMYVELADKIERLNTARRRVRGNERAAMVVDLKIAEAVAEMEGLKTTLERVGSPIDLEIRLNPGRNAGMRMREILANNRGLTAVAAAVGADLGTHMGRGVTRRFRQVVDRGVGDTLKNVGGAAVALGARGISRIGNTLSNLSEMTVRLGPFTATIRQVIVAMSLFAPIILDMVGALGSLVSVVGSATLGLGALSIGFLGGALPAALGMGLVIKDLVQEFVQVKKAQKAYDDALAKGNTELAAKKLKELRAVMGNVSEETAKQIASAQDLGKAWDRATEPARASAWTAIGEAIKTGRVLMDDFADRTVTGMDNAERATTRWQKALRSPEGRQVINNMMDNFNESIEPLLGGLGNLAAYLGKVGSVASDSIPGIARDFENWSERVLDTADDMSSLKSRVDNTIESLRKVGGFFMSAGRLMKAFFGGGVAAGQDFAQVMTNAMDGWTRSLNTAQGQANLGQFFSEAVSGARAFYNTLAPVISSFVRWAGNIAPFARAFFEGAAAVSRFVSEVLRLTGLQGPVTALVTTLGVLWGLGKIRAATAAVAGFTRALLGMKAAQTAVAGAGIAGGALGGAAAVMPGIVGGGARGVQQYTAPIGPLNRTVAATEKAAQSASKLGRVTSVASKGLSGLGAAALGLSSPLAGAAILAAGAGAAIYLYATRTRDYTKSMNAAEKATSANLALQQQIPEVMTGVAQSFIDVGQSSLSLKQAQAAVKDAKKGTDEYRMAMLNLQQARLNDQASQRRHNEAIETENDLLRDNTKAAESAWRSRRRQVDQRGKGGVAEEYRKTKEQADAAGLSVQDYIKKMSGGNEVLEEAFENVREYADALGAEERAQRRVTEAHQAATLAHLNQARGLKGLTPLTERAAAAFHKLAKLGGKKVATDVAINIKNPGKAEQAARAAGAALKSGVPKSVVSNIVVNAKSANEAIRKLNAARITPKRLEIIEQGGAKAIRVLENIIGRKLTRKEQQIAERGGPATLAMLRNIIGTRLPDKSFDVRANDYASSIVNNVISALSRIPREVRIAIRASGRVGPLAYAGGGQAGAGGEVASERDERRAGRNPVQRALGSVVRKPTFLAGEESGHPEFVIATNPKVRKRNRNLLRHAAAALGAEVPAFAAGGAPNVPSSYGTFNGSEFNPKKKIKRRAKFKPAKKQRQKFKARRGWADYIDSLHTQQGIWEREVSLREGAVREPEDMVIKSGQTVDIKDPLTGEVTKVDQYVPNPAIADYKSDMNNVLTAMRTLMSIVAELVRAIPEAIAANRDERKSRGKSIKKLNEEIDTERGRLAKADKDDKQKHKDRIEKLKREREKHEGENETLRGDEKTLTRDRETAGMDYRQYSQDRDKLAQERASIDGKAAAEANDQMTGGGSGGGGGAGGAVADAIGVQEAAAASMKMDVLRQFGSNMAALGSQLGAAVTGIGNQGMQVNPSSVGTGSSSADSLMRSSGTMSGAQSADSIVAGFGSFSGPRASGSGWGGYTGGTTSPSAPTSGGVIINNTFASVPPDPHTWSKGIAFEMGTMIG